MEFLISFGTIALGAFSGWVIPQFYTGLRSVRELARVKRHMKQSVFAPALNMKVAPATITATPKMGALEDMGSRKNLPVDEYIKLSSLQGELRNRFLNLASSLEEAEQLKNLTVDDEHDLGVVKEGLFSSIRMYDSFTERQRQSDEVTEQMNDQLDVLESVIDKMKNAYEEAQMREFKITTAFLSSKFKDENLDADNDLKEK